MIIRSTLGLSFGVIFSVLLFKRRTWPAWVGLGFGAGRAWEEADASFRRGNQPVRDALRSSKSWRYAWVLLTTHARKREWGDAFIWGLSVPPSQSDLRREPAGETCKPACYVLHVQYLYRRQGIRGEKRLKTFIENFLLFLYSVLYFSCSIATD